MSRKSKSFHPSSLPLFLDIPLPPPQKIKEAKEELSYVIIIDIANDSIDENTINEYQIT